MEKVGFRHGRAAADPGVPAPEAQKPGFWTRVNADAKRRMTRYGAEDLVVAAELGGTVGGIAARPSSPPRNTPGLSSSRCCRPRRSSARRPAQLGPRLDVASGASAGAKKEIQRLRPVLDGITPGRIIAVDSEAAEVTIFKAPAAHSWR